MKHYKLLLSSMALIAGLSSCNKAVINGSFVAAPASGKVTVKTQENGAIKTLDTLTLAQDGTFRYKASVSRQTPEFFYLFCGDTKVSSLLLKGGDKVSVECDTAGRWSVSGSEECEILRENEMEYAALLAQEVISGQQYLDYYRKMTKFVLTHSHSLTVVPVLLRTFGETPLFAQASDGILFLSVADSLAVGYPSSYYVKYLRTEGEKRKSIIDLQHKLRSANAKGYIELNYPDVKGQECPLSSAVKEHSSTLLVFWDATDASNKLFNQDILLPLYRKYRDDGLKIYAVNIGVDKATWAMVVREQQLPWTNVCDTKGNSLVQYAVDALPSVFVIKKGEITRVTDIDNLVKILEK